jgi:hypothetical protein
MQEMAEDVDCFYGFCVGQPFMVSEEGLWHRAHLKFSLAGWVSLGTKPETQRAAHSAELSYG